MHGWDVEILYACSYSKYSQSFCAVVKEENLKILTLLGLILLH
jgi:hypothetical protein